MNNTIRPDRCISRFNFIVAIALLLASSSSVIAQRGVSTLRINDRTSNIVIRTGNHYLLEFSYRVPDLWIGNRVNIDAQPIGPNKIMITGHEPGVTTLTVSDEKRQMQALTVQCVNDVRDIQTALDVHFPGSLIKAHPVGDGIVLRGVVSSNQEFTQANEIATQYYENVLNHLQVDGAQMVAISVKVYEVSRTKLREVGTDWSYLGSEFSAIQSVSGLIQSVSDGETATGSGQTLSFGVLNNSDQFNAFINLLEQRNLAKLLDEPTLVAENGRAAEFLSGGEIPVQISNNFGASSIEFRSFGTKLDIVPLIHGHGSMTLEVKAEVSDVATDLAVAGAPGFRVRRVNTGVRMKSGQTLALAGDYREEVETVVRGIPGLMDSPLLGPLFRDTRERKNETELVFLITPKFIEGTDAHPSPLPGQASTIANDFELYRHGVIEVDNHEPIPQTVASPYRGTNHQNSWGHVQGYGQNSVAYPISDGYSPNSYPSSPVYQTPTNAAPGYQPGYEGSQSSPRSSGASETLSDTTLRPVQNSTINTPPLPGSASERPLEAPKRNPRLAPSKVEPASPVMKQPQKKIELTNPFENIRIEPIEIDGPYGFSK